MGEIASYLLLCGVFVVELNVVSTFMPIKHFSCHLVFCVLCFGCIEGRGSLKAERCHSTGLERES